MTVDNHENHKSICYTANPTFWKHQKYHTLIIKKATENAPSRDTKYLDLPQLNQVLLCDPHGNVKERKS